MHLHDVASAWQMAHLPQVCFPSPDLQVGSPLPSAYAEAKTAITASLAKVVHFILVSLYLSGLEFLSQVAILLSQ